MKTSIVHKTTTTVQPSASTSFNLATSPEELTFSWYQSRVADKKEDDFFRVMSKIEYQPRSTILFKID